MTWVIGMPGLPTRGVVVGDVRITVRYRGGRETEHDGVQKVYCVAPNIVMGFAGNIDAGFRMVDDFAGFMRRSVPDGYATNEPSRAVFKWARRARYMWANSLSSSERCGGCSLLFVAARPPVGPFTPTVGYVMSQPDFAPMPIPPGTARSIGSGAHVAAYVSALQELAGNPEVLQFETMHWDALGGAGLAIALSVSDAIDETTPPGISPHLHICSVRFGAVELGTNDRESLTPGLPSRTMPAVVTSWQGWCEWKTTHVAAHAVAVG